MNKNMMAYSEQETMIQSLIERSDDYQTFKTLPIVSCLSKKYTMLMFSCMTLKSYQAGDVVYQAGTESVGEMFLVLDGKASATNENGHKYKSIRKGEVFGLFSFLDSRRSHSASITVDKDMKVITLERSCFDLISLEDPKLGAQLMRFMFRLLSEKALQLEVEYAHMHNFAFGRTDGGK